MRWILDDGPFGHLARCVDPEELDHWQSGLLWVAGTTAVAATQTSQSLLDAQIAEQPVISTFEIRLGQDDPAAEILVALHGDPTSTTDLAEHESIAWAQTHGIDAVFVCADRRAALTALAELGHGRVGHPFDVWLDLKRRGWIDHVILERLCRTTKKHDQGLPRLPGRVQRLLSQGLP